MPGGAKTKKDSEALRTKTNFLVVLAGVAAVVLLAVIAIELLHDENDSESTVAITTAAFGIVSTLITAHLGIKATANASDKSEEASNEAALARYEEQVKESKVDRLNEEIDRRERADQITPEVAKGLRDASVQAEEESRRSRPSPGRRPV